jgi:LmbE family N-acetylglucosaminyl deacetylase
MENLQLLTIVAHPHDITYTLGTSAHHIKRGDKVTAVSLTDGVTTHHEELEDEMRKPENERRAEILNRPRDEQAHKKLEEFKQVCGLFGITDARVMPFADNPIEDTPKLHDTLANLFYEIRPDMVIMHAPFNYPYRNHWSLLNHDHPKAGQLVWQTMQRVSQPDRNRKHSPHHVAQLYYIGVEFGWTEIDVFVDITDEIDNRIKAEALYESQGHTSEFGRKRIEAFAGYAGWFGHAAYAEPFIRARAQTSDVLPITPNDLADARSTGRETLDRMAFFASRRDSTE